MPEPIKAWYHAAPRDGVWVGTIGEVAYGSPVEAQVAAPGREIVRVWIVLAPHDQPPVPADVAARELREAFDWAWAMRAKLAPPSNEDAERDTEYAAYAAWRARKGER